MFCFRLVLGLRRVYLDLHSDIFFEYLVDFENVCMYKRELKNGKENIYFIVFFFFFYWVKPVGIFTNDGFSTGH